MTISPSISGWPPAQPTPPAATLYGRLADQTAETAPAEGTIVFTALAADVVDSSTTDLLHRQPPKAVTLDEFGRFVFTAQDSDTSWKVQLLSAAKRTVWTRHWVPSPGLAQNVRDLVVVDPATLEPTAVPEAAWWAALAAMPLPNFQVDPDDPAVLQVTLWAWQTADDDPSALLVTVMED